MGEDMNLKTGDLIKWSYDRTSDAALVLLSSPTPTTDTHSAWGYVCRKVFCITDNDPSPRDNWTGQVVPSFHFDFDSVELLASGANNNND